MTTRRWLDGFGFRGASKQRNGTTRRSDSQRTLGVRTILLEQLEERTLLSGGRPTPAGSQGQDIALGSSYTWNAAPNYSGGCHDSGDVMQLTDGQYTNNTQFWERQPTVGWVSTNPVDITIDLGVVQPIQGASFSTAGGIAGVYWPTAINVMVSNDNVHWFNAKTTSGQAVDLVAMDPSPPQYGTYAMHTYSTTNQIATFGRYVKFDVVANNGVNYVFADEIQVFRGANSLLGQNAVLGSAYTMSPAPNYIGGCTDSGDVTQLTDGQYTTASPFWNQVPTVGWTQTSTAQITIDLGQDKPIEGVSFDTAAGTAGVTWPTAINVSVSTDGVNFNGAGEAVSLSALDHGQPPSSGVWSYWTERLVTHGRYVRIVAAGDPYIFVDEIEVYEGRDEMLGRLIPSGSQGDNVALGTSYTWNVAPTYSGGCQDSGDVTQLTDGQYTNNTQFWERQPTVGWVATNPVDVTIDLGVVQPIQGVSFNTAGGVAGVYWPTAINVTFSNDNIHWYDAINLVALDPNPPQYGVYAIHNYVQTNTLATIGRYVKFDVVANTDPSYVFADEIQVYRGADSLLGQNIARGRSYTMNPSPNYSDTLDSGDATQLTDGQYSTGTGLMWMQQSTVGWVQGPIVQITTIDLGQDEAIEGVSFNTAGGVAGVNWPEAIVALVSTDGTDFYSAGEIISLSADHGLPQISDTNWTYWTERLATHGRYVKIVVVSSLYIFIDEIEVYQGRTAMLSQSYQGTAYSTDDAAATFATTTSQCAMETRRIVLDAQDVRRNLAAETHLTSSQKAQYTAQLNGCIAQAIYQSVSNNVVLPINTLHAEVFAVQAAQWQADGLENLKVWTTPSSWDFFGPTQTPLGSSASVGVTLMKNEYRSCAVNISNSTSSQQEVYVTITGLPDGTNPDYITVQEVAWTDTNTGIPNLAALPNASLGGNGYIIQIPSGMTRQIWLTFHPATTTAGTYSGTIGINGGSLGTVNVPVSMRVSALMFPDDPALGLGGWDQTDLANCYGMTLANRAALISQMTTHLVDTAWSSPEVMPQIPNPTDFTAFDNWVGRWPANTKYCVFLNSPGEYGNGNFAGYTMGSPQFNSAIGSWINAYVAHWQSIGVSLNQIALELVDEPSTSAQADIINAWATAIHAAQPNALLWINPWFSDPNSATAQAVFVNCNIICLNTPEFVTATDTFRQAYEDQRDNHGKTLSFYSCYGPIFEKDPYNYYRLQAWTSFKESAQTMNYWSFVDQGRASSWTTQYPLVATYTPLFLQSDTVTDGKVMDAIREGVEDYQYLKMLKDKIATMRADNCPSYAIHIAQNVLDVAIGSVLGATGASDFQWYHAKDRTVADTMRIQVLDMLESLSNYPSVTILTQPTDQATELGSTATFFVVAAGSGTVTHQWQLYSGGTWGNISGATAATYTTPTTTSGNDGGQYRVVVTNSHGSVTSGIATLYVNYGLEAWWKLDETSGSASDSTGKAHTGTLTNGPVWRSTGGALNGALDVDGTNDYVAVPATSTLRYTTGQLTLSTWIWIDSTESTSGWMISKYWDSTHPNYWLSLGTDKRITFGVGNAAGSTSIVSTSALSTDTWHHLAATVDTGKTMRLYVDGIQAANPVTHSITSWPSGNGVALLLGKKIAGSGTDYDGSYDGKLDNVRIYTHNLRAEAISDQARAPVGYWKFNDAVGNTANDSSGNAYAGTLNGPTWTGGYLAGALDFDGTNDYVSVPSVTAMKYTGGDMTLSARINVDSAETTGGWIISKAWNTNDSGWYNYQLYVNPDRTVTFGLGNGTTDALLTSPNVLAPQTWHYIVATVNSASVMTLYIDGIAVATRTHSITTWSPTDQNLALLIGSKSTTTSAATCFDGKIDDVHTYDPPPPATAAMRAPRTVQNVVINDGNAQRSMETSVTIMFSTVVRLDSDAFQVVKKAKGQLVALAVTTQVVGTLTFSGSLTENGSIKDGECQLTACSDKVHNNVTQAALDGNRDGVKGGDFVFNNHLIDTLFRKYGDSDGDRDVDGVDLLRFRKSYLTPTIYEWYFEFEGDGEVDGVDLLRFKQCYQT